VACVGVAICGTWLAGIDCGARIPGQAARRRRKAPVVIIGWKRHKNPYDIKHLPAKLMDPFYKYHVFFCLNQRDPDAGRPSCANCNAQGMQEYAKKRVKQLGLAGDGKVRINKAGCLERCELGPVVVVYPEGTWYTYVD